MSTALGVTGYRWENNFKSFALIAAFPFMLLTLLGLVFYIYGVVLAHNVGYVDPIYFTMFGVKANEIVAYGIPETPYAFAVAAMTIYWPYVFGVAAVWVIIGYLFNSSIVHAATGAKPVARTDEPQLYNLLENLCISRGMKMPKLYVIETDAMNAYASGINDSSYAITVTRGIIKGLDKDEIEAVLGHELTHIINCDCRLLIATVVFAGMLSFIAQMLWRNMHFVTRGRNNKSGGGTVIFMLIASVVMVFGYFLAVLLRFALSRRREYMADAGSVELTKNPEAMIGALRKISQGCDVPQVPSEVRQMFIENPPSLFDMGGLFATHPPIELRIHMLEQIAGIESTDTIHGESVIPPSA